jgi:hypothetical protein
VSDPPDLFDYAASRQDSGSDKTERNRVYGKIAPVILAFATAHAGEAFHAEELRRTVTQSAPELAPSSADRILRMLRQEGRLDYVVLNRRQSLYQFRARGMAS